MTASSGRLIEFGLLAALALNAGCAPADVAPTQAPPRPDTALVFRTADWEDAPRSEQSLDLLAACIQERVAAAGIVGSEVETGEDSVEIRVQSLVPNDLDRLKRLLARRGRLQFMVAADPVTEAKERFKREAAGELYATPDNMRWLPGAGGGPEWLVIDTAVASFKSQDFEDVRAVADAEGRWQIEFELVEDRREAFAAFTGRHLNRYLAIVSDGEVLSVPQLKSALHGAGVITGNFDEATARALAAAWAGGPLPLRLEFESARDI